MEESKSKNNYIYVVLALIFLIAAIAWAYFSGRRDGAQHKADNANQNVNAVK